MRGAEGRCLSSEQTRPGASMSPTAEGFRDTLGEAWQETWKIVIACPLDTGVGRARHQKRAAEGV